MPVHVLEARPLTREAFAPFGEVIETDGARHYPINRGTIERFDDLAAIDVGDGGHAVVGIVECTHAGEVPLPVRLVERHPVGSQAFIPMGEVVMCVVVAPAGETVAPDDLRAFVSNGRQGVNYHRGTWHMPLVAFERGQRFVVIDRGGPGDNCEERELESSVQVSVAVDVRHGQGGGA
ncbi:MAG: ureidoglycolate lyase [Arenicellales bacterium]